MYCRIVRFLFNNKFPGIMSLLSFIGRGGGFFLFYKRGDSYVTSIVDIFELLIFSILHFIPLECLTLTEQYINIQKTYILHIDPPPDNLGHRQSRSSPVFLHFPVKYSHMHFLIGWSILQQYGNMSFIFHNLILLYKPSVKIILLET